MVCQRSVSVDDDGRLRSVNRYTEGVIGLSKYCGKCGREMADIDRVCGWCGTPVSDYDVSCEELPRIPELPSAQVKITDLPQLEVVEGQQVQYESIERLQPATHPQAFEDYPAEDDDPYLPTDEARPSRDLTIEDVPAVEAEQRQTKQIVILSIIAAVLVAIAAIIFFVFKPFDNQSAQTSTSVTETAGQETTVDADS